ncbi:hypothetical protein ACL00O_06795 [Aeromonas sanarellii]|uniref:hypothetical protein n=1 Tax=Aeromonas sanarellii TaxID=633415 RepID=UPI0039A3C84D
MWMSKVKEYLQELDTAPVLKAVFIFSLLCISLVFVFAVINGVKQMLGVESIDKIITVISSLATTLTLAFLVYQHQVNDSKHYQMTMVDEAKLVIEKMIEQIEELHSSDVNNIEKLDSFMIEIANHILDFNSFYDDVNHPTLRKILNIRWQDMYYNHYDGVMKNIDVLSIIRKERNWNSLSEASLVLINDAAVESSQGKSHKDYEIAFNVLSESKRLGICDLSKKIDSKAHFKKHFLNSEKLKKYLGVENYTPKSEYPSLCALVDLYIEN